MGPAMTYSSLEIFEMYMPESIHPEDLIAEWATVWYVLEHGMQSVKLVYIPKPRGGQSLRQKARKYRIIDMALMRGMFNSRWVVSASKLYCVA